MLQDPARKYRAFAPIGLSDRRWPDNVLSRPPIWCSTDLRDGNQALIEPMDRARKLRMFELLTAIGFKQIEVGFPSASQTEFDFVRMLVEESRIPEDVTIQALTPARPELIRRTFDALEGAPRAIVHLYHATAPIMRRVVFGMNEAELIKRLTVPHVSLVRELAQARSDTDWTFEFSPEMFSTTELEFTKRVVDTVTRIWEPTRERKCIVNLPSTVERSTPNVFADMIEWADRHFERRDAIVLSVHPHNDRGTGTAAAELALMAGADRIEGCLFGNGERTGNVDLVNLAMNLYTQGVSPGLDFSDMDEIRATVEHCNRLPVHPRHPYVGDLVYTSFSGSHQDAIKKAFAARSADDEWEIPYLPVDPRDVGRSYDAIVRVNSQSGKGGISYLLEADYGLSLPRRLQIEFSRIIQDMTDATGTELRSGEIWAAFEREYLTVSSPFAYKAHRIGERESSKGVDVTVELIVGSHNRTIRGTGNGPIDALMTALCGVTEGEPAILGYHEHSLGTGANAAAVCYVELKTTDGKVHFGAGIDPNIVTASFKAVVSALNRQHRARISQPEKAALTIGESL
jgi:2-isopropylmalate synthase